MCGRETFSLYSLDVSSGLHFHGIHTRAIVVKWSLSLRVLDRVSYCQSVVSGGLLVSFSSTFLLFSLNGDVISGWLLIMGVFV